MIRFTIIFLFFSLPSVMFSQIDVTSSVWVKGKITVDGKTDDWKTPFEYYNSKARLTFSIANDSSTLYICFINTDKMNQLRIINGGMKISLILKTSKKINAAISYPFEKYPADFKKPEEQKKLDKLFIRDQFKLHNKTLLTSGFYSQNGKIQAVSAESKIKAVIDWDTTNNLVYELAIPFSELIGPDYAKKDLTKAVTLQVEVLAAELPGKKKFEDRTGNRMRETDDMPQLEYNDHNMLNNGNRQAPHGNPGMKHVDGQQPPENGDDKSFITTKAKFSQKFFISNGK